MDAPDWECRWVEPELIRQSEAAPGGGGSNQLDWTRDELAVADLQDLSCNDSLLANTNEITGAPESDEPAGIELHGRCAPTR